MLEINKLYNMDCVKGMRLLDDECIDLTVTSPPYDNLRDYKGYYFDVTDVIKQLYRVTKKGGVVVWVVGDATVNGSETGTSFRQALYFKDIGFNLHDTMIYKKNNPMPVSLKSNRYANAFEYCFVLSKGTPKTANLITTTTTTTTTKHGYRYDKDGKKKNIAGSVLDRAVISNIWGYNVGFANAEYKNNHPATFPEKLAADHIYSWSNENDIVLDPFTGSGTTPKMAIEYKRRWIAFEISKEYCNLANKRIETHKMQLKLF